MADAGRVDARPQRRRPGRLLLLVLLLLVLCVAWAGWQAAQGARSLTQAADGVRTVQADLTGADVAAQLPGIGTQTAQAREHLEDPLVRLLAVVPRLGDPLEAAVAVSRAADITVREALEPLVRAAGDDPAGRLTQGPGAVDVDYLAGLRAPTAAASEALGRAAAFAADAPGDTGIGRIDDAVEELRTDLDRLRTTVDDAALAVAVAPELLAAEGTRRYLVVSQSPAEARGTGGLIGGYSLLEVTDGALTITRSGPRSELTVTSPQPVVDLGAAFQEHYGLDGPALGWVNSNLSPHFPYAARIWMELWKRQYGQQLDGAIVLDPVALSYLLEATGPVGLPDGTQLTPANVVDLTLRDVYARFPFNEPARDRFLQSVSTSVASALISRELPGRPLVTALQRAVSERRLLLWSAKEDVQRQLVGQPVSGTLPPGRTVGDVIVDSSGGKLDYYLERALAYTPGCGDASSRLSLRLTNAAPATGLPDYVTPERPRRGQPPGTNLLLTTLYLPSGSELGTVTIDGVEAQVREGVEQGLVWAEVFVTIRPGATREVVATFDEPLGSPAVQRLAQPLVRPESFTAGSC